MGRLCWAKPRQMDTAPSGRTGDRSGGTRLTRGGHARLRVTPQSSLGRIDAHNTLQAGVSG